MKEFTIKQAIDEFLNQQNMTDQIYSVRLNDIWERLMGKTISMHTLEIRLRKGKVFIRLDSSVLREELTYAKQKIIQLLNRELQTNIVEDIIFQ